MKRTRIAAVLAGILLATSTVAPSYALTVWGTAPVTGWIEPPHVVLDAIDLPGVTVTCTFSCWRENMVIIEIRVRSGNTLLPPIVSMIDPKDVGIKFPDPKPPTQPKAECVADCNTEQAMANDLCDIATAENSRTVYGYSVVAGIATAGLVARSGGPAGALAAIPVGYAAYKGVKGVGDDYVAQITSACRSVGSLAHYNCLKDRCHA